MSGGMAEGFAPTPDRSRSTVVTENKPQPVSGQDVGANLGVSQVYRALAKVGEADQSLCKIIDAAVEFMNTTRVTKPPFNGEEITKDGCRVTFGRHQNLEGSLYISMGHETVRFRWGGCGGTRHVYLITPDAEQAFMLVSSSVQEGSRAVVLRRLDGHKVKELKPDGVEIVTREMVSAYYEACQHYRDQAREANTWGSKFQRFLHIVTAGLIGTRITVPPEPKMESTTIDFQYQRTIPILEKTADMLYKAADCMG